MLTKQQQQIVDMARYIIDDWYSGQPCEPEEWLGLSDAQGDELCAYVDGTFSGKNPPLPDWILEWLDIGDTHCLVRLGCRVRGNDLTGDTPREINGKVPMDTMAALGAFKFPGCHTPW